MKRNTNFLIICLFLLLLILFISTFEQIVDVREVGVDFKVTEHPLLLGLNPETDALHFGTIPKGNKGIRNFTIFHNYEGDTKINIRSEGKISPFLVVSDNNFVLKSNSSKEVKVTIKVPADAKPGQYNGTLKVYFKKPLINW